MGHTNTPTPALLLVAAFSRHGDLLALARQRLEDTHGPVALASPEYAFDQTRYYEPTMGPGLRKQLWAFERLIDPADLPAIKHSTNALEQAFATESPRPEPRPINLDPGYLTLAKLVLATTKDQAHRLYLRDGIFAEITLQFRDGRFQPWPWTYADYRLPEVLAFLAEARAWYRQRAPRPPTGEPT
jgi:hypothetical protein